MKKDNMLMNIANIVGQVLAFFTVALWLLCLLNSALSAESILGYHFLGDATGVLEYIKYWATLLTLALSGLEFASRRVLLMIIYLILVAGCVILMFFPGVLDTLVGMATGK